MGTPRPRPLYRRLMRLATTGLVLGLLTAGCMGSDDEPVPERPAAKRTCAPTDGHSEPVDLAAEGTPSRVRLGPGMELKPTRRTRAAARRGEPLVVEGVVSGRDCRPLAGATVQAHQTNGDGEYGPGEGEQMRCCYLQGTARTDAAGRYALDTVMPGGYDNGRAHVHLAFGHPEAAGLVTELVLSSDGPTARFDVVLGR